MGLLEWSLLVSLSMLWGGAYFFVGVAVEALPPFTIVLLRLVLGAIALNLVVLAKGLRMPAEPGVWLAFFSMGLLNNMIPYSLIVWGQTHIASGLASIFNATTPLFVVVIAHFLTHDERMTRGRVTGLCIGFAGVVLIIGPEALAGLGTHILAQVAVLAAAMSYAFAAVHGRRFRELGVAPLVSATGQVTASAILLLPLTVVVDRPWTLPMPEAGAWGAVAGLALLSTALAHILYFRVLATAGATNVLLVSFLTPASAIVLGTTLLGERLELEHFAGMALIGIGLAAIDGRLFGFIRQRLAPAPPDAPLPPDAWPDGR